MIEAAVNESVTADADEAVRKPGLRRLGEVDDLGHVRQVVAAKRHEIGAPRIEQAEIGAMILDLQIDQPDLVACLFGRLGDELEPIGSRPQKDLGIMEHAGIDAEQSHASPLPPPLSGRRDSQPRRHPTVNQRPPRDAR